MMCIYKWIWTWICKLSLSTLTPRHLVQLTVSLMMPSISIRFFIPVHFGLLLSNILCVSAYYYMCNDFSSASSGPRFTKQSLNLFTTCWILSTHTSPSTNSVLHYTLYVLLTSYFNAFQDLDKFALFSSTLDSNDIM